MCKQYAFSAVPRQSALASRIGPRTYGTRYLVSEQPMRDAWTRLVEAQRASTSDVLNC